MSGADNRVKVEQIVGECFVKAAHVILGARTIYPTRRPSRPTQKSWVRIANTVCLQHDTHCGTARPPLCGFPMPVSDGFGTCRPLTPMPALCLRAQFNLDIEEVEAASRELEPWRRNFSQPLVLEVRSWISTPRKHPPSPVAHNQSSANARCHMIPRMQVFLEPWGPNGRDHRHSGTVVLCRTAIKGC